MIRLLIVEAQPELRWMMHLRLAAEADICVIGVASDDQSAIRLASTLCPDIVLVDVDVPGLDGIQSLAEIHRVCPGTALIALSIHDDPMTSTRVKASGAVALVIKSNPTEALLAAIREAAAGTELA